MGVAAMLLLGAMPGCAHKMNYPDEVVGSAIEPGPWSGKKTGNPALSPPSTAPTQPALPPPKNEGPTLSAADGKLPPAAVEQGPEEIELLLSYAKELMGRSSFVVEGKRFPKDCSGYMRAIWHGVGINLYDVEAKASSGTEIIYHYVKKYGALSSKAAQPGDLIFFHNTYDRNKNGRRDDNFTHIALVERVEKNGTIVMLHVLRSGVVRSRMNLQYGRSHLASDGVTVLNDYLRRGERGHRSLLTSELFYRFGRIPL